MNKFTTQTYNTHTHMYCKFIVRFKKYGIKFKNRNVFPFIVNVSDMKRLGIVLKSTFIRKLMVGE